MVSLRYIVEDGHNAKETDRIKIRGVILLSFWSVVVGTWGGGVLGRDPRKRRRKQPPIPAVISGNIEINDAGISRMKIFLLPSYRSQWRSKDINFGAQSKTPSFTPQLTSITQLKALLIFWAPFGAHYSHRRLSSLVPNEEAQKGAGSSKRDAGSDIRGGGGIRLKNQVLNCESIRPVMLSVNLILIHPSCGTLSNELSIITLALFSSFTYTI